MRLAMILGAVLAVGAALGWAQTPAPAPACPPVRDAQGNLVSATNCAPGTPTAPAAKRFPYPGEETPAAPTSPAALPNSPAAAPGEAPQGLPNAPAGKRFPYPGETDAPSAPTSPADKPDGSPLQDAGSSGDSSSSSSSSSSAANTDRGYANDRNANDPDANDPAAIPRRERHKLPAVPRQSPSEREQEDVQVAGFYFNDGNFRASYDRAKEAATLDNDDPEAQLALGNAARKLGRLDEADKAYKRCLELDPVPKVRKAAEKAVREMTGG